jgi:hypothetical protein
MKAGAAGTVGKSLRKDSHILEIKDLLDQAQEDSTLLFPEIIF